MSTAYRYNQKSDMWALGCVLYEMLTLRKVFDATVSNCSFRPSALADDTYLDLDYSGYH